ncbi:phage head morphogenesis protein, partial [Sansalvadorimonas verongulae]|uniref:phage head morphogenesis protein n=1 Tax=Sansalvadorimonas verongulae TaxID=2172824 RepID=UPI0022A727DB
MYDAIEDDRVRLEHLQWNATVAAVTDPFWKQHYPPNGWNCRCGVVQMTKEEVEDNSLAVTIPQTETRAWTNPRTGKVRMVSTSVDPGWDHNPGET